MTKIIVTPRKVRHLLESMGRVIVGRQIKGAELTAAEILAVAELFPAWSVGEAVAPGDIRRYEKNIYECLQGHTTQEDWPPDATPALWKSHTAPGIIPEWVQPLGAGDAYPLGATVTHNAQTWTSIVADNVWEPGAVGTEGLWVIAMG